MRKWKKKQWLFRRQKKIMRKLSRRKKNHYKNPSKCSYKKGKNKRFMLEAPKVLCIKEDNEAAMEFFSLVFETIKKCQKGESLFFDLSKIEIVSPAAIMYLIAVINNTRRIKMLNIKCSGNVPVNNIARKQFESVGFYNYVNITKRFAETKDPERIRILHGKESNVAITSSICDFVNEKCSSNNLLLTKRLYPMLVELMTNVKQHAYHKDMGTMNPNWYIYVENTTNYLEFVFLDTGRGIPATVRKNWAEKLITVIGLDKSDTTYIVAALRGEFRTETKEGHRGKGLPEIYNASVNPKSRINDLVIVSGGGLCKDNSDGTIDEKSIAKNFEGTLFSWKFEKEVQCNVNN